MTMPNAAAHPDPERLAALAGDDADARADSSLVAHVAACETCGRQVDELASLRVALASLPDLAPSRPLQLLPPVAEPAAAASGWRAAFRRAFAPVAVAGLALLIVGGVGATGALGPADAERLLVFSFQQAAGPASPAEAPAEPEVIVDESGGSTDPERPATAASAPPDHGAFGETPLGEAAGGEDGTDADPDPSTPRSEDLDAETTVTSGWVVVAGIGLALLLLASLLRLLPKRSGR
jgi:hypothetical protein